MPGSKTAIIGPSGAGKSTLLSAISGFHGPDRGDVIWNGTSMMNAASEARPLSVIFQDGNLFPHLSIGQNVGLGIRPNLRLTQAEKDRCEAALTSVGLSDMSDRMPGALSGGQQSRAALARVLLQAQPLLILDEPFAALGPALRKEMLDLVADVVARLGATMLMVTHDPDDARYIADQVIFVADGVASAPVPTDAIFANPPKALADYLGK
ncbi:UNVERIFIED_CONTAM: hypothetical protein GTU68_018619 [Idotea baltica]|nr:hypothetical protein [Idotea baltica]